MNWAALIYPARIAALPRTERGIPVPFFVAKPRPGQPYDLRFSDARKALICARKRVCWVCGQPLEHVIAFVGGPISGASLLYGDGPMHRECAEFSLMHCPFMATPQMQYSERHVPSDAVLPPGGTLVKPDHHVLTLCTGFTLYRLRNELLFRAQPVSEQIKWQSGKQI